MSPVRRIVAARSTHGNQCTPSSVPKRISGLLTPLGQSLNRPVFAAVSAGLIYGVFLLARLSVHGFEPSYFVIAGTNYYDAPSAHPGLKVVRDGPGYDGQFYYRLAINPLSKKIVGDCIRFDSPAYLQQRILFPLLGWIVSLGNPEVVPWALILLNYAGLCAIAYFGALLAQSAARHAAWGLVLALYPGFIFSFSRDLTEIVASAFLLAGLFMMRESRGALAAACFSLSVLARETTLIVPSVVLLTSARRGRTRGWVSRTLCYAIPLAVYAMWRMHLNSVWATVFPLQVFDGAIGWPFSGIAALWSHAFSAPTRLPVIWCAETCLIGIHALRSVLIFRRNPDATAEGTSLVLYAGLAACLARQIWVEDQSFFRATTEIFLLGSLGLMRDRARGPIWIYSTWALVAAFTFYSRVEW